MSQRKWQDTVWVTIHHMSSSSSSLYHLPSPLCVRHIKREISQAMINSSHFRECTCHIPFIMFWFLSLWKRVGAELSCELWMTFWFGKRLIWKCSKNVLNNFLIVFNEKLLICSLTHTCTHFYTQTFTNMLTMVNLWWTTLKYDVNKIYTQ